MSKSESPRHRFRKRLAAVAACALLGAAVSAGSAFAGETGPAEPLGTPPTSAGSLGPATLGGPITRATVIARANDWMNVPVMYSTAQGPDGDGPDWNYWTDSATGGPYRQDCSGFVSMAWGLTSSMASWTLPQVSTVTDTNLTGDLDIEPGDALDIPGAPGVEPAHVVLFDHWSDSDGGFAYDAEHTQGQPTNQTDSSVYDSDVEGFPISDFEVLRYNNIENTESGRQAAALRVSASTIAVYWVDASGQLHNSYQINGGTWNDQNLSTLLKLPETASVGASVVTSAGDVGVYWIDTSGHLHNTYQVPGGTWGDQDLTALLKTPPSTSVGAAVYTSAGNIGIYTIDTNGHLHNTYQIPGGTWGDQDLTALLKTPLSASVGAAVYTSAGDIGIYTVDTSGHLHNTYQVPGGTWGDQDLTSLLKATNTTTVDAAIVTSTGDIGVYTQDTKNDLNNIYQIPGGTWNDQNLTTTYNLPPM